MPELPDVELFRSRVEERGLGRVIARTTVSDQRILRGLPQKRLADALAGHALHGTRRHGKHLLLGIEADGWLVLHFGMTGDILVQAAEEPEPRFTRVRLDFADGGRIVLMDQRLLGSVGLAEEVASFVKQQGLGPDALSADLSADSLAAAFASRRTAVKAVLMDQAVLAGLGNIYADEVLFHARLHPQTPARSLDRATVERLLQTIRQVLETAVRHKAGAEFAADRLPSSFLLPHRAAGRSCPRCGSALESLRLGGRQSYFCPRCQPAP